MAEIKKISEGSITNALSDNTRQYLIGNLKLPQELEHIQDSDLEIGITDYKQATSEAPHTHTRAKEYQYMIGGRTEYLNIHTGKVSMFEAGDFYLIETGVAYAQRSEANTTILFIKYPGGNDKVDIEVTPEVSEWLNNPVGSVYHG